MLRVYWMLVGAMLPALLAILIARQHGFAFTLKDVFYWLGVASVIAARYVDIRFTHGQTAEGAPATMKHWAHYALILGAVALLVWISCHLVAANRG